MTEPKQQEKNFKAAKEAMISNGLKNIDEKTALERFNDNIKMVSHIGAISSEMSDDLYKFLKEECLR